MIYIFRCSQHGQFEDNQPMNQEHIANCPVCSQPTQRVYLPLDYYWPNDLWNPDGSRQSPDELPPVPQDQNWGWHGFGEGKKKEVS